MCGIFALINPPECRVDVPSCRQALKLLRHRGPDASGEWLSDAEDVFLGHCRLSIIDLSERAAQPMVSQSGNVLIYNGEIYNFKGIRADLESKGCRFKSDSDTEVLLQALDLWGIECLNKFEGMFAFVYWRPQSHEAFIARDFLGIKPLYFFVTPGGGLAISSEIKAFSGIQNFVYELDSDSLAEYLHFRNISGDGTLLHGIKQVKPGQAIHFKRASSTMHEIIYWDPVSEVSHANRTDSPITEIEFLHIFRDTIERHLIADVPVGTQFSGGIDSSLISLIAAKDLNSSLTGFHCHVKDASFDETPIAYEIARLAGIDIEIKSLSPEVFFSDLLEKLSWHNDEPLSHPNSMGIYLISEAARNRVKALLSGEAADELFGGYSRYPILKANNWLYRRPLLASFVRAGVDFGFNALNYLERWSQTFPIDHKHGPEIIGQGKSSFSTVKAALLTNQPKLAHLSRLMKYSNPEDQILSGTGFMAPSELEILLGDKDALEKSLRRRRSFLLTGNSLDIMTRCQVFDVQAYLPTLLMRQDKMSMAASIENRVPFATPEMLSIALRLPSRVRTGFISRKHFLKACLSRYLPKRLANRKKYGFGIPISSWLRTSGGIERLQWMIGSNSPLQGLMDMKRVRTHVENFQIGSNTAEALWTFLSLAIWLKVFFTEKHFGLSLMQKNHSEQ